MSIDMRSLARALSGATLEKSWHQCVASCDGLTPAQIGEARMFVARLHEQVLTSMQDTHDGEDRTALALTHYLHLKSYWKIHNMQIGYQMAAGRLDHGLMLRASMITPLIDAFERHLEPSLVAHIEETLLNNDILLGKSASSLEVGVLPAKASGTFKAVVSAVEPTETAQDIDLKARIRSLKDTIADLICKRAALGETEPPMAHELNLLRAEMDILSAETGKRGARELVALFRQQSDTIYELEERIAALCQRGSSLEKEFGDLPTEILIRRWRHMNETLKQMENEHLKMQAYRQRLEREIGQSDADETVRLIQNLRERCHHLESEAVSLRNAHERLRREMGGSDVGQIVNLVRGLNDRIAHLRMEIAAKEPWSALLEVEIGTSDALDLVARFHEMKEEIARLRARR